MSISHRIQPLISLLFLTLLSCVVLLWNLGGQALIDYDEAAYADIATETFTSGNPLSLSFKHLPWFEKPPLFFWMAHISQTIFSTTEFAFRFSSALATISTILLLWFVIYNLTKSSLAAFIGGSILLTTASVIDISRQVRLDAPVMCAIFFTSVSYLLAKKSSKWNIGIGVGIAVGIMIKSVIGFFSLSFIILHSICTKNFSWCKDRFFWIGNLLGFLIVVPWHIYQTFQFGTTFWSVYVKDQLFQRFSENLFPSALTLYQFFTYWFYMSFPWSFLIMICLVSFPYVVWRVVYKKERVTDILILAYTSTFTAAFIFLLFSVSKTKAYTYLMPMYPFIALALTLFGYVLYQKIKLHKDTLEKVTYWIICTSFFITACVICQFYGFHSKPDFIIYNYPKTEEEKQIGLLLQTIDKKEIIYFYTKEYWETVRFYSKSKNIDWLGNLKDVKQNSYYLVIPRDQVPIYFNPTLKPPTLLFDGEQLKLYKIAKATL